MNTVVATAHLKILINFILEQASEYELGPEEELRELVSDMWDYMNFDPSPGNSIIWFARKHPYYFFNTQIKDPQTFFAAFKFLNEIYCQKNKEITLNTVIQALEKCLSDISENKENPLYAIWLQYLQEEEGSEYTFD
jgi:hypothetical protein